MRGNYFYKPIIGFVVALCALINSDCVKGDILISQYYESGTEDRLMEFVNVGFTDVTFSSSGLFLGAWQDASAEDYKNPSAPDEFVGFDVFFNSITMAPDDVLVLNLTPGGAIPLGFTVNASANLGFDGNDSLAIYSDVGGVITILDAIGFTDSGAEGLNTSWERIDSDPGFDSVAGSNVTDFTTAPDPEIWRQWTTADVDNASGSEGIGTTGLTSVVPEPSGAVILGIFSTMLLRRRKT